MKVSLRHGKQQQQQQPPIKLHCSLKVFTLHPYLYILMQMQQYLIHAI